MLPTRFLRVAAVTLAAAIVACGDTTRPKATSANIQINYSLYPLTGSPAAVSNAVSFFGGPTRADATFNFDVAFDVDATGKVVMYPVRSIAGTLAGGLGTRAGLQPVTGSFESLREAPEAGYDTITVKTITPGQVVAVELIDLVTGQCIYSLGGQRTYAKFVVDSVDSARRLYLRSVVDLNCGYRSLVPDEIPTN
ncbi:MAG TPA: hypothetical protein VGP25_07410 [Gemmatimonadaceae bacterium]|jgi:hypothetical protein|nr:hypothetical protein [Gemmatimonadaceae bacterium]